MNIGINSRNIADLHPAVARGCRELIRRMSEEHGFFVGVSSTYRDRAFQDHLFAQGRTRPGNIVTNARGGQSIHNHMSPRMSLAFDIFLNIRGQEWSNPNFFATAGRIWVEMGGEWGGNWLSFPDRPHFQYTGGLSLASLQTGAGLPLEAKMKWEPENEVNEKADKGVTEVKFTEVRFNKLEELPGWALPTVEKLVLQRMLQGDEQGNLNLSEDMLRMFVIHDRAGVFDRQ